MNSKEIIMISLVSLFLGVMFSFFYPGGADLPRPFPPVLWFLIEFCYYAFVIALFDENTNFNDHLFYAVGSFLFRVTTSLAFAAALATAGNADFRTAIRLGIIDYVPEVFPLVIVSPWVLLTLTKGGSSTITERGTSRVLQNTAGRFAYAGNPSKENPQKESTPSGNRREEEISSSHRITSFNDALEYLRGFRGVKGIILTNTEGTLIDCRGYSHHQAEEWAAYGAELFSYRKNIIAFGIGSETDMDLDYLELASSRRRISVFRIYELLLIVFSERKSDELVKVGALRTAEILSTIYKNYEMKISSSA